MIKTIKSYKMGQSKGRNSQIDIGCGTSQSNKARFSLFFLSQFLSLSFKEYFIYFMFSPTVLISFYKNGFFFSYDPKAVLSDL